MRPELLSDVEITSAGTSPGYGDVADAQLGARYTFPSPGSRPPGSLATPLTMTGRQEHVPAWKDSLAVARRPFESMSAVDVLIAKVFSCSLFRVGVLLRGPMPTAPPTSEPIRSGPQ